MRFPPANCLLIRLSLHELAPNVSVVAIIVNPNNPQADEQLQELQDAAHGADEAWRHRVHGDAVRTQLHGKAPRQNHHLTETLCLGFGGERRRSTLANPLQIGAVTTSGAAASSAGKGMGRFGCAECPHPPVCHGDEIREGAPSTALRGGDARGLLRVFGPVDKPPWKRAFPGSTPKCETKCRRSTSASSSFDHCETQPLGGQFSDQYARVRVMGSYIIQGEHSEGLLCRSWDSTDDHRYPLPENRTRVL
jgi:hypothetical protein